MQWSATDNDLNPHLPRSLVYLSCNCPLTVSKTPTPGFEPLGGSEKALVRFPPEVHEQKARTYIDLWYK